MTVSSELNRKQYTGDGVTTSFATSPVVFFDTSDLVVYVVTTATGASTTLTENTHYTVSGGDGSTGTVSLAGGSSPYGAPSAAQTLVIVRDVPLTQAVDFVQNDASDAEVVEDALDKLTMAVQQQSTRLDRSFVLADSDVSGASLTVPTPSANKLVGWNSAATALENKTPADIDLVTTTAFVETLLDDATAGAVVTTLTAALTVDSAPDPVADYVPTYDASAATGKKTLLAAIARAPAGAGRNVAARTDASTPNSKLNITADELVVRDTNGHTVVLSSVSLTSIDITASGANGLDTGAEAGDTWYYGWVIYNPTTGTAAGLISASATAPTMPSGYTFKALVTAARNNGSSNFVAYRQQGNEVFYTAAQSALSTTTTSTTEQALSLAAYVPPVAIGVQLQLRGSVTAGGGGSINNVLNVRHTTGSDFIILQRDVPASGVDNHNTQFSVPNISQQIIWLYSNNTNVFGSDTKIEVLSFKLPGGGE